ncbi:head-tail connector protein [Clostridium beijerinckii]|uniref:Phage gp6-like head-tail connector protein n=1 Tax=Clostridium beijerinckii TaxID=1520 RepID=A0A1S8S9E1_CLOBE|nr:head-tail connector protein [Clostridium beijerinckii]NRY59852.1 putative phage protein (predicted DNA packaging) [Clostridium beijerinckii]OOM62206.1 phage gp6-like head-tail connector protein [Clostridium beijerinckii]
MTLDELKLYLYIDSDDEDDYLNELIEASEIYIESCVGISYKQDEKAVKLANLLMKKLCSDLYENRGTEIASNTKKDIIVTTILEKLSLYDEDVTTP